MSQEYDRLVKQGLLTPSAATEALSKDVDKFHYAIERVQSLVARVRAETNELRSVVSQNEREIAEAQDELDQLVDSRNLLLEKIHALDLEQYRNRPRPA
jgi:septal ring factor EnvC (AmiA/AmiB activator)